MTDGVILTISLLCVCFSYDEKSEWAISQLATHYIYLPDYWIKGFLLLLFFGLLVFVGCACVQVHMCACNSAYIWVCLS